MNVKCESCAHAQKNGSDLTGRSLLCFRNPPYAFPMMGPQGVVGVVSMRPQVNPNDVACGEYETRDMELAQ